MKPSDLIKNNYILDLNEGMSDMDIHEFLEFCDSFMFVDKEKIKKYDNIISKIGELSQEVITLTNKSNKLNDEQMSTVKELDISKQELEQLKAKLSKLW